MDTKELIEGIKKKPQTYETLSDLFSLVVSDKKLSLDTGYETMAFIRKHARKIATPELYDLTYRTYVWGGANNFDQFMIACEWYREPNAQFWLPRRKVLEGKHGIATKIQRFIDDPNSLYLGFSLAPGTGKTTLIKFLLSYIVPKYPRSANMYVTYADGLAKMMYDSVFDIITNEQEYRTCDVFPDNGKIKPSAEYLTLSYRKKGDFPTISMGTIGGSLTGRTRANKFLITDDLVKNAEMARSPERLDNLYNDYKSTILTRTIGDDVKQIQLGTIWSKYDPISRMKADHEDDPRYTFIAIPVWDEDEHSNFLYDHPDRYTDEKIRELKETMDNVTFSCLYMQKGIDKEGIAFPLELLNWYYDNRLPEEEPDNVVFACDVAWGGGDSLAMPIGYIYGEDVYIHDVLFDKGNKEVTQPRVVGKILSNKARMGQFEANNGGDEYAASISKSLNEKHYSCLITSQRAPSTMSKISKIEQYAPDVMRFHFNREKYKNDKEYRKFIDEMTSFSFSSKNIHDDAADGITQLASYILGKKRVATIGKRPC